MQLFIPKGLRRVKKYWFRPNSYGNCSVIFHFARRRSHHGDCEKALVLSTPKLEHCQRLFLLQKMLLLQ